MYNIRQLGLVDYELTLNNMKEFTEERNQSTADEFWILEHNPIFTLGAAGVEQHIINKQHSIPILRVDRGGQVTYHGPGQIIIYVLIDLNRLNISIRQLVIKLESGIINYLLSFGISAQGDRDAPGVYIDGKKIASIGLKVRKNCTYHGISFNFNMDTTPFNYINVCGYSGLKVVQLKDFVASLDQASEALKLANCIINAIMQQQ
jgi:lipoyl(octanoyl) transferase